MGTRGCVAVGDLENWIGVYNSLDSYPTSLGIDLWEHLKEIKFDLEMFCAELLKYEDWQEYLNKGVCAYCGKQAGHPHPISLAYQDDPMYKYNLETTGYPDPEAKYHLHGDSKPGISNKSPDPLYMEWVYIVDKNSFKIYVLHRMEDLSRRPSGKLREYKRLKNGSYDYGHCVFRHFLGAEIDLNNPPQDWELLKNKIKEKREQLEENLRITRKEKIYVYSGNSN